MNAVLSNLLAWAALHAPELLLTLLATVVLVPLVSWMRKALSTPQLLAVFTLADTAFEMTDRFARLNPAQDGFDKAAQALKTMRDLLGRELTQREKIQAEGRFEARHNELKRAETQKVGSKLTSTTLSK